MEASTLAMSDAQYYDQATYAGTEEALGAHGCGKAEAVAAARGVLRRAPRCAEAWVVLAQHADSFESALERYTTAERVAREEMLKPGEFERELREARGSLWGRVHLRAWVRAMFGRGNTLRKMGRHAEALEFYERLSQYQADLNSGSTFFNFHTHIPELLIRVHGAKKALALARNCMEYKSSGVTWNWNVALAFFQTGRVTGYPQTDTPFSGETDFFKAIKAGNAILYAIHTNSFVADLLLGKKEMPGGRIPAMVGSLTSELQAVCYVHSCGDLWRDTPGALDFLRRVRNTVAIATHLEEVIPRRTAFEPALVEAALRDGADLNAHVWCMGRKCVLLSQLFYAGRDPAVPRLARLMMEQGARMQPDGFGLMPLHHATYAAAAAEGVEMLLDAGAQPQAPSFQGDAVSMAANQGSFEALGALLARVPNVGPPLLRQLFYVLTNTSVLTCVAGGERCQRCQGEGSARPEMTHPPEGVSFSKCASTLVKFGLRMDSALSAQARRCQVESGSTHHARLVKELAAQVEREGREADAPRAAAVSASSSSAASAAGRPQQQQEVRACAHCGGAGSGKLLRCARCRAVRYCGAECQRAHWPAHKPACVKPAQ